MNVSVRQETPTAQEIFSRWLETFSDALERRDTAAFKALFAVDGYWKDMLSFTWDYPTYSGPGEIADAFARNIEQTAPFSVRAAPDRTAPRFVRRTGRNALEGFFCFETKVGHGTGFVRLFHDAADPFNPQVWLLLTTLQSITGFEEQVGKRRPTGNEFARNMTPHNWHDARLKQIEFADRDPQVLIVGSGHSGLTLAARLKVMGVDALVVERHDRVGDNWRKRYHALTLHNQTFANHLPYLPFPEAWHVWLPKDKLAGWLETYVETLELNVWTGTELIAADYDEHAKRWTARLRRKDGTERTVRTPHIVMATGVSGSIPKMPDLPGIENFGGACMHSSQFTSGKAFQGKHAIVVGTGNSGHDVAQDLYVNGAEKVWVLQRGPCCVVSLEPTAMRVYSVYSEGPPAEDVDLTTAAIPYPILKDTYQWITKRARAVDKELLDRLNAVGFETHYGADETGFHMMYLRGEGGYYIDVGCSQLIANGKIGVLQLRDVDTFVADGVRLKDGTMIPCDLVVCATGFRNMRENVRRMLGDEVADRVGPIWGFDEQHTMRNMWRRTPQEGFWVMGGGLIDARLFSRYLALQIIASLNGLLGPLDETQRPRTKVA